MQTYTKTHEPSYKQLEVKTNRTSFLCGHLQSIRFHMCSSSQTTSVCRRAHVFLCMSAYNDVQHFFPFMCSSSQTTSVCLFKEICIFPQVLLFILQYSRLYTLRKTSNLVCTTNFWNILHQVRSKPKD